MNMNILESNFLYYSLYYDFLLNNLGMLSIV
jgi:hypothetical protein